MANLTLILILLVVLYTKDAWFDAVDNEIVVNNYTDEKIVGGNETTIQMFSYQAYILFTDGRDFYECGGAIINDRHILTASHCVTGKRSCQVRIGSTNKFYGGYTYNTSDMRMHPLFDPKTYDYDVAMITLNETMNLDGYNARTIRLVRLGNDPRENQTITITGWGKTAEGGNGTEILRETQVPVVNRTTCNALLPSTITSRMFCAGYQEGGVDTCQGDSGGPAVIARYGLLAGITSFGYGCGRPKSPGVYTRVGDPSITGFIRTYGGNLQI